jgi:hypothetical protein
MAEKKETKEPGLEALNSTQMSQIQSMVASLVDALKARPERMSIDEELKRFDVTRPPGRPQEVIECVSEISGSKFTAVVCASRTFPNGRVVKLENYRYATGSDTNEREGGLVPNGITVKNKSGTPTTEWHQWRWENFWKADLCHYVGNELPVMARVDATPEQIAEWIKTRPTRLRKQEELVGQSARSPVSVPIPGDFPAGAPVVTGQAAVHIGE